MVFLQSPLLRMAAGPPWLTWRGILEVWHLPINYLTGTRQSTLDRVINMPLVHTISCWHMTCMGGTTESPFSLSPQPCVSWHGHLSPLPDPSPDAMSCLCAASALLRQNFPKYQKAYLETALPHILDGRNAYQTSCIKSNKDSHWGWPPASYSPLVDENRILSEKSQPISNLHFKSITIK